MNSKYLLTAFSLSIAAFMAACGDPSDEPAPVDESPAMEEPMTVPETDTSMDTSMDTTMDMEMPVDDSITATAMLMPTEGNETRGELTLAPGEDGVHITGSITGLPPDTKHGFHIHETGDCSAPDGKSAGGHFNPMSMPHGDMTDDEHHAGDMPNIESNGEGMAEVDLSVPGVELGTGSDVDVMGKAFIVHASEDDYTSQPTGAAGARLACGVITEAAATE